MIIAAIVEQPVIEKILKRLGLQAQATPRAHADGPHASGLTITTRRR